MMIVLSYWLIIQKLIPFKLSLKVTLNINSINDKISCSEIIVNLTKKISDNTFYILWTLNHDYDKFVC